MCKSATKETRQKKVYYDNKGHIVATEGQLVKAPWMVMKSTKHDGIKIYNNIEQTLITYCKTFYLS